MGFEPFIGNLGQLELNKKAQYYLHRYKDIFSVFNKINAKENCDVWNKLVVFLFSLFNGMLNTSSCFRFREIRGKSHFVFSSIRHIKSLHGAIHVYFVLFFIGVKQFLTNIF